MLTNFLVSRRASKECYKSNKHIVQHSIVQYSISNYWATVQIYKFWNWKLLVSITRALSLLIWDWKEICQCWLCRLAAKLLYTETDIITHL